MAHGNVRVQERYELSLGGTRIAAIVVGALVALVLVFFLGFQVGQRVGTRRAEAARPATLGDLDLAASSGVKHEAPGGKDLTFSAELPRARPATPPPARPATPPATAPATPQPASAPAASAAASPASAPASDTTTTSAGASAAPATGTAATATAPARGGWTVQLGASQRREEAEALAHKVQALGPRIEEADIPGKGHFFRVRVGRFESRPQADRYRSDVIRESGISGVVVPPGG